ncbi:hypothetical protein NPX13_g6558 [Xylaria arbuscula]|uniref:Uncharacterized protein n=1 Tax=Xylaria arbuscula TaxID=114810 RepID=A0A9W8NCB4_9PEZI|nr:hypothetical protein NPX13_g6558 [Xylaria arbuscula]
MAPQTDKKGVIVIGIDFGTTFTGVAYTYIPPGNEGTIDLKPVPITNWPASDSDDAHSDTAKVPSRISYTLGGNITWGHQAPDNQSTITWFKLLLLDAGDLPPHLKNSDHIKQARERVRKTGKDAVTVISDFLAKVWHHVLETITRALGQQFAKSNPIQLVITVPAMWQDYAVLRMENAIEKAGILANRPGCDDTTYTVVSEPEAASLASIDGFNKHGVLVPGQTFIVADLGGGTVDIFSFRVKSIQPQLALEEIVEGDGALCGGTFLDQAFLAFLIARIQRMKSKDKLIKTWKQLHSLEQRRIVNIVWEKGIKRKYCDGQSGRRIDLGAQGNRRPDIWMEAHDLNSVFDSTYNEVSRIVQGQIDGILSKTGNKPKFIVLTGGFGRCEYIYQRLSTKYKGSIEILFENNDGPWTAVARGAVLSGAAHVMSQDSVQSRISRYSYGWTYFEPFCRVTHDMADYSVHEITGRPIATDQMKWVIHRGENIKSHSLRSYRYSQYFHADLVGMVSFKMTMYRSNLIKPPKRLKENEANNDSTGMSGPSDFRKYVDIDMQSPVAIETLPKLGGEDFPHRVLQFRLELNISGSCLIIKAISHGQEIGKKTISGILG